MLKYYAFRLAGFLIPLVPQRLGYALVGLVAGVIGRLPLPANDAVRANLRQILGPAASAAEIRRLARSALRNNVINYYELFLLPSLSLDQIAQRMTIHGAEYLHQARAAEKGLILTTAHFGNFNLAGQVVSHFQIPTIVVVENLEPPAFLDYVCRLRAANGLRFIPVGQSLRPIVRALHANEAVGLAADRDVTGGGEWFTFFGAPARIPVGHVKLALRTGAPVLPCFAVRQPNNHSQIYIEPPMFMMPTGDFHQDVRDSTERIIALLERYIQAHPDQWLAFQPIWNGAGPEACA